MGTSPKRIFLSPPHMGGTELEHVKAVFDVNYVAPAGPQLAEFERRFCELTGFSHAVAVSSGTAALHLALRMIGAGPEDVVVASDLTFIGSVTPALFQGAEPVFVDSDEATWNMDPRLLAEALNALEAEGRRVAAVIPTDIYGQCADYDAILGLCEPRGIPVVLDAAESVGASYKGRHAGRGAYAAAYSFNGNKIITTSGGGMLCSDDAEFISEARNLSQQARDPFVHYEHSRWGYNYRLSNVLAGIGLGQLEVLEERVRRRREVYEFYVKTLGGLPGVSFMPEAAYGTSTRWLSVMLLDPEQCGRTPEELRLALEAENIESRPVWKPMHMQPVFAGARVFGGGVSERLFAQGLCLPSGTAMSDEDMGRVAEVVRSCLA